MSGGAPGSEPSRATARLMILAAAGLFSTGGAAIKLCSLGAWQVAGLRSGIAALFLIVALPAARRRWGWRSWLVGAAYAATLVLFVQANKLTTAANAIYLQSTAPLYLLLLGPWLLREPIRRRHIVLMAAVGLGMALFFVDIGEPSSIASDPRLGNWLGVASGVTWALAILGLRWISRQPNESGDSGITAVVAGSLLALAISLPFGFPLPRAGVVDWGVVIYLGVFQIGVAYICLTRGVRAVPAFEASLLILLEPVLNPVWAWLVHDERPGPWAISGGALILVATLVNTRLSSRPRRSPS